MMAILSWTAALCLMGNHQLTPCSMDTWTRSSKKFIASTCRRGWHMLDLLQVAAYSLPSTRPVFFSSANHWTWTQVWSQRLDKVREPSASRPVPTSVPQYCAFPMRKAHTGTQHSEYKWVGEKNSKLEASSGNYIDKSNLLTTCWYHHFISVFPFSKMCCFFKLWFIVTERCKNNRSVTISL